MATRIAHGGTPLWLRSGGAWLASLSFCVVYLACLAAGAGPWTILTRSLIAAAAGFFLGRLLMRPLVDVVLEALAEHERLRREEARRVEEEGRR